MIKDNFKTCSNCGDKSTHTTDITGTTLCFECLIHYCGDLEVSHLKEKLVLETEHAKSISELISEHTRIENEYHLTIEKYKSLCEWYESRLIKYEQSLNLINRSNSDDKKDVN